MSALISMASLFGIEEELPLGRLEKDERLFVRPQGYSAARRVVTTAPTSFVRGRFYIGLAVFLAVFFVYGGRAFELQALQASSLRAVAENNRLREVVTLAHRGRIFDRNGIVLAQNEPLFQLLAERLKLPEKAEERMVTFANAAVTCGQDPQAFEAAYQEGVAKQHADILLAEGLSYECAMRLMSAEALPSGLRVELAEKRTSITTDIPSLSHVLGYTSSISEAEYPALEKYGYRPFDRAGKQGLEKEYEVSLRGHNGTTLIEVDAGGNYLRTLKDTLPEDGKDLTLALDARLQAYIETVLQARLQAAPIKRASVVMTDPKTGEVLAMVSYPAYNANDFSGGISEEKYQALLNDPNAPLFNRCVAGEYPSGSTIKPLYASAALTEGVITPQTSFISTGGLWLGDRFFPDWRPGGHGQTNVYHAIADSVNTFFYAIGGGTAEFPGMGVEKLMDWARRYGLGSATGIDFPSEGDGFLPSKDWKQAVKGEPWYIGDTYNVSIGQGDILTTPLQINTAIASIANNGVLVPPHFTQGPAPSERTVIDQAVADIVQDAMRETVTNGSARMMQDVPVPVAGKTGTAQWSQTAAPHSWFTGFAPFEDPQVAITVLVEQGGDLTLASPVAHDILMWYFGEGQRGAALTTDQ